MSTRGEKLALRWDAGLGSPVSPELITMRDIAHEAIAALVDEEKRVINHVPKAKHEALADEHRKTLAHLDVVRAELAMTKTPVESVWVWSPGDAMDLTCPVVMSSDTLNGLVTNALKWETMVAEERAATDVKHDELRARLKEAMSSLEELVREMHELADRLERWTDGGVVEGDATEEQQEVMRRIGVAVDVVHELAASLVVDPAFDAAKPALDRMIDRAGRRAITWWFDTSDCLFCSPGGPHAHTHESHCSLVPLNDIPTKQAARRVLGYDDNGDIVRSK